MNPTPADFLPAQSVNNHAKHRTADSGNDHREVNQSINKSVGFCGGRGCFFHSLINSCDLHACLFGSQAQVSLTVISLRLPFASATAKPIPCGKPHPRARSPKATGLLPSRGYRRGQMPSPSPGAARIATGKTVSASPPSISAHQDAPLRPRKTIIAVAALSSSLR